MIEIFKSFIFILFAWVIFIGLFLWYVFNVKT